MSPDRRGQELIGELKSEYGFVLCTVELKKPLDFLRERYGGKIWVENRVYGDYTRGSVFTFILATP